MKRTRIVQTRRRTVRLSVSRPPNQRFAETDSAPVMVRLLNLAKAVAKFAGLRLLLAFALLAGYLHETTIPNLV